VFEKTFPERLHTNLLIEVGIYLSLMKASIIIPTYNGQKTIHECLTAIANQTQPDFEVIVVDDGSTDNTATRVKAIAKKDPRFKLLRQKNAGPARARNQGARAAQNPILIFIDDDCTADTNWLLEMLKPFSNKQIVGVQGRYKTKQKQIAARFGQIEIDHRYSIMARQKYIDFIGSYAAAYSKKVFLNAGGFDETFRIPSGEDPELSYRLAEQGHKMVFNPRAIVYHYHPASLYSYLKTKFYRAFWRVRMYKKHTNKIIKDSYTPQGLKFQMLFFYAGAAGIVGSLAFPPLLFWGSVAWFVVIVLSTPFSVWALFRDPPVGVLSPIIIFLRTAAFCAGFVKGIVNKTVMQ
jgi:glycosyltransferase involved in cell wall biosynthesis